MFKIKVCLSILIFCIMSYSTFSQSPQVIIQQHSKDSKSISTIRKIPNNISIYPSIEIKILYPLKLDTAKIRFMNSQDTKYINLRLFEQPNSNDSKYITQTAETTGTKAYIEFQNDSILTTYTYNPLQYNKLYALLIEYLPLINIETKHKEGISSYYPSIFITCLEPYKVTYISAAAEKVNMNDTLKIQFNRKLPASIITSKFDIIKLTDNLGNYIKTTNILSDDSLTILAKPVQSLVPGYSYKLEVNSQLLTGNIMDSLAVRFYIEKTFAISFNAEDENGNSLPEIFTPLRSNESKNISGNKQITYTVKKFIKDYYFVKWKCLTNPKYNDLTSLKIDINIPYAELKDLVLSPVYAKMSDDIIKLSNSNSNAGTIRILNANRYDEGLVRKSKFDEAGFIAVPNPGFAFDHWESDDMKLNKDTNTAVFISPALNEDYDQTKITSLTPVWKPVHKVVDKYEWPIEIEIINTDISAKLDYLKTNISSFMNVSFISCTNPAFAYLADFSHEIETANSQISVPVIPNQANVYNFKIICSNLDYEVVGYITTGTVTAAGVYNPGFNLCNFTQEDVPLDHNGCNWVIPMEMDNANNIIPVKMNIQIRRKRLKLVLEEQMIYTGNVIPFYPNISNLGLVPYKINQNNVLSELNEIDFYSNPNSCEINDIFNVDNDLKTSTITFPYKTVSPVDKSKTIRISKAYEVLAGDQIIVKPIIPSNSNKYTKGIWCDDAGFTSHIRDKDNNLLIEMTYDRIVRHYFNSDFRIVEIGVTKRKENSEETEIKWYDMENEDFSKFENIALNLKRDNVTYPQDALRSREIFYDPYAENKPYKYKYTDILLKFNQPVDISTIENNVYGYDSEYDIYNNQPRAGSYRFDGEKPHKYDFLVKNGNLSFNDSSCTIIKLSTFASDNIELPHMSQMFLRINSKIKSQDGYSLADNVTHPAFEYSYIFHTEMPKVYVLPWDFSVLHHDEGSDLSDGDEINVLFLSAFTNGYDAYNMKNNFSEKYKNAFELMYPQNDNGWVNDIGKSKKWERFKTRNGIQDIVNGIRPSKNDLLLLLWAARDIDGSNPGSKNNEEVKNAAVSLGKTFSGYVGGFLDKLAWKLIENSSDDELKGTIAAEFTYGNVFGAGRLYKDYTKDRAGTSQDMNFHNYKTIKNRNFGVKYRIIAK